MFDVYIFNHHIFPIKTANFYATPSFLQPGSVARCGTFTASLASWSCGFESVRQKGL